MQKRIELLKHQDKFLFDDHKFSLSLGGIGSAKTTGGSFYTIKTSQEYPKALGAIFANSYRQLSTATLPNLFTWLDFCGIKYNLNKSSGLLNLNGTQILTRSTENYDDLRGFEIGWYWWDESAFGKEEAFHVLNGRLRDKRGPLQGRLTSSPNGFNWLFDYFAGEKKTDNHNYIKARSADNIHLPEGYLDSLIAQYDKKMILQELEGEFVNINSGQIYHAFDREHCVKDLPRKNLPIWVGMDFNVNPMTAVFAEIWDDTIYIFDEMFLLSSNTHKMREEIKKKYGVRGINIVPDGTGKALKTSSAGVSDHVLLKEYFGYNSIIDSANPYRQDRFNCVNNLLEKYRILINPKCKMLIKDLEQVTHNNDDKMLSHISDALGYLCWRLFPITINNKIKVTHYA